MADNKTTTPEEEFKGPGRFVSALGRSSVSLVAGGVTGGLVGGAIGLGYDAIRGNSFGSNSPVFAAVGAVGIGLIADVVGFFKGWKSAREGKEQYVELYNRLNALEAQKSAAANAGQAVPG